MQHKTGAWKFFLDSMIKHFLNKKSKLKVKLFETLKKKSKKFYCSNWIDKCNDNIWDDMKEIIGKSKFRIKKFSYRIVIDEKEVINEKAIWKNSIIFCKYLTKTSFKNSSVSFCVSVFLSDSFEQSVKYEDPIS